MIDIDKFLCVIPARCGSKGIARKNMQIVAGKPLVEHSITQAIRDGISKKNIVVSSDSQEILDLALSLGVMTRDRPAEISTDTSSTEACLIDAYYSYPLKHNIHSIICLQPTSPIRFKGLIKRCMREYADGGYNCLVTTTKLNDFYWIERFHENSYMWYSTYNVHDRPMKQQLSRENWNYFDNGNVYISNVEMLLETKCRLGDNPRVFVISELEGIQIDTMQQLYMCDAILRSINLDDMRFEWEI
jgi:N-acylneuraminate cytidylyltransferase